jgi:hypothetical protein
VAISGASPPANGAASSDPNDAPLYRTLTPCWRRRLARRCTASR